MMAVFQMHNECNVDIVRQRQQIANCTFLLIPKIISTLANVATGDSIIGETVIAVICTEPKKYINIFTFLNNLSFKCSIDAIHRILHLIFTDYSLQSNAMPKIMDFVKNTPGTSTAPKPGEFLHTVVTVITAI